MPLSDQDFTALLTAAMPTIHSHARKFTKDRDRADDLTQDTMMRCWEKRHLYTEGNFQGWVKTVMRHLYYNQQEVEARMRFTETAFVNGGSLGYNGEDAEEGGRDAEWHFKYLSQPANQEDFWLENRIMEVIANHLPSHSALLIQKRLQGMEYKKIAKALGITPNNAKQRHFNDTKVLRKRLLDLGLVD